MKEKVKKPFYKKWWFWVLAVIVVIAISGGGNGSDSKDTSSKITDEKKTETTATTPAKKEETKKEPEKAPVVVFDNEQVTISFKSADGNGVKFLVENKTDKSLTIQADSVAINGFSSNDITMSDDIAPKSKGYAVAKTTELADAGTPETVSGSLRVIDTKTFDTDHATFTNVSVK
ncbi:hypothetical protein WAX78_19245 [Bacillus sp. FJAT-53711]|uniref:DUF4352 domain-containing protein n=1 Tax=Bacillus yunxiaonensis TaxID=3127665 RepID=A0ABU8G287_9BACI